MQENVEMVWAVKMMSDLRALDLTDESGFFCGKILGEFGVDVIKIEPPGGDLARNKGPFYHDIPDPEKSLYWLAYNESKRGITLNIETPDGQDIFRKLAASADFVVESSTPGYMDSLGLSYQKLSEVNPGLIMTSITPFGQTGPYKNYTATDLIAMAMGGVMSYTGEPDGLPCRLDPYHSYCSAGSHAALGTLIAYYYRELSGEGQHVDVSMTECVIRENFREVPTYWEFMRHTSKREGSRQFHADVHTRMLWPCKDGHVTWTLFGGRIGLQENAQLADWLKKEALPGELDDIDWSEFSFDAITQEQVERLEEHILNLTLRHTKQELEDEALRRGIRMSAVNSPSDLYKSSQLQFREFWKDINHPELKDVITYPGQMLLSNEIKAEIRCRAPLIGEHNKEIYQEELGFDNDTMADLKQKGVI